MKYASITLIILCFNALDAQTPRFSVNPNPNSISFDADSTVDHLAHGRVKNQTGGQINILWVREILQLPEKWATYVCDANSCFGEGVNKCPELDRFLNKIKAGDSTILDVHVRDSGYTGQAHIVMWVFEQGDTANKIKVDYLFNKVISNNEVKNIEIKMYPNPAFNAFTLDFNQGLNRIELYSILGKKVASYKAYPNHSYDISPFADGIYFVKLLGPGNQLLKTIRLLKRSYKP